MRDPKTVAGQQPWFFFFAFSVLLSLYQGEFSIFVPQALCQRIAAIFYIPKKFSTLAFIQQSVAICSLHDFQNRYTSHRPADRGR
jgi:hypothetical protein